ncbi:MAG: hypothetical protein ACR2N8_03030 [Parvibaculales bacterium]
MNGFPYSANPVDNEDGTLGISNSTRGSLIDDKMRSLMSEIRKSVDKLQANDNATISRLNSITSDDDSINVTNATITNLTLVGNSAISFNQGTTMLFYQSAAPIGWSISTEANVHDTALRVVTSDGGVRTFGGAGSFSTVFRNRGVTVELVGNTGSTTLTRAQMPSHTHNTHTNEGSSGTIRAGQPIRTSGGSGDNSYVLASVGGGDVDFGLTSATGGGEGHTHPQAGNGRGELNMGVTYLSFLLCRKN